MWHTVLYMGWILPRVNAEKLFILQQFLYDRLLFQLLNSPVCFPASVGAAQAVCNRFIEQLFFFATVKLLCGAAL